MSATATTQGEQASNSGTDDRSLKLAIAISLLRSKAFQKQPPILSNPAPSDSDALRWKRKAKERKQELLRLREDLKEAEDASHCDLFPRSAYCKCYFFVNLGKLSPKQLGDGSDRRFNDVLRRRFLRQVRLKEQRRKTNGSIRRRHFSDLSNEDEMEHLRASVDFLLELCNTVSPVEKFNFENWTHQAVDFILGSLKNLLVMGKKMDLIEGTVSGLIVRLIRRMCSPLKGEESYHSEGDAQFRVQHLLRKLGSEPYIGQRIILSASQRISAAAESLLFLDPFDSSFPSIHKCMFVMIQLIEFLISDYLLMWSKDESFDNVLLEEWLTSVLHAKKALELLENRNGLYVLYMDRVTSELAKQVVQNSTFQKLTPDILNDLLQ